jgi:hypothetical protein
MSENATLPTLGDLAWAPALDHPELLMPGPLLCAMPGVEVIEDLGIER